LFKDRLKNKAPRANAILTLELVNQRHQSLRQRDGDLLLMVGLLGAHQFNLADERLSTLKLS
jgi:hypothetical protein